jgi:hypothetical protein
VGDAVAVVVGEGLVDVDGLGLAATGLLPRSWRLAMSATTTTAAIA